MGKDFRSETAEAMSRFQGSVRKAFTGYYRIKDLIRRTRATKTAHDERTLVAKESAAIRSALKDASITAEHRYHSVGKLIYIHLMGYPALFGQVECMKLAATVGQAELRIKDKRMGYLGVSLLSDEHQETLTLVTNSFKYDLNHVNEGVVSLALSALAQCLSPAMARELAPEIDRLLHQPASPILRKKAAACAVKMIQKDPELAGEGFFVDKVTGLIGDKNASVVLGGVNLMTALLSAESGIRADYQKLLPVLIKASKNITASPFDPEYDVSGVPSPVLHCALLKLMRRLGTCSEEYIDLLAILATTLADSGKNAGHAVAFEVAQNIMAISAQAPQLQSLSTEILNKFLASSSDSNLRFVALNLLKRHGHIEVNQTVLGCLHDADISIRKAAMQVSLSAATPKSITQITNELLSLCRRERDDLQLIRECLRDLKSAIGRCSRGAELLALFISLLKAQTQPSNEVVTFVIGRLRREMGKERLAGPLIAKEFFFALTIAESDEIVESDDDDLSYSSTTSQTRATPLSLPLLQVAIWSFGCWAWQGIVQESLCTSTQLIELLVSFINGPARSFALIALVKLAAAAEKNEILNALNGNERDIQEAKIFITHGISLESEPIVLDEDDQSITNDDVSFDESIVNVINDQTQSLSMNEETPVGIKIGRLQVIIKEFLPQNGKLSVILSNRTGSSLSSLSVALAAAGGFDFDYLKAADCSTLPSLQEMELVISLKKRSDDLLQFDLSAGDAGVDYSACKLKMRVQYDFEGETETHISPLQFIQ